LSLSLRGRSASTSTIDRGSMMLFFGFGYSSGSAGGSFRYDHLGSPRASHLLLLLLVSYTTTTTSSSSGRIGSGLGSAHCLIAHGLLL
jgi:hypothetical protein